MSDSLDYVSLDCLAPLSMTLPQYAINPWQISSTLLHNNINDTAETHTYRFMSDYGFNSKEGPGRKQGSTGAVARRKAQNRAAYPPGPRYLATSS